MYWMSQAGTMIAPWWSTTRDHQLRNFWKDSDHFAGAMYMISAKLTSVPWRVEPRDMSVRRYIKQADHYNALLSEGIAFGKGWEEFWSRFFEDYWCSDNGAFAEVIGAGNPSGPIKGPVIGVANLDSLRCMRTSNPIYPVIYQDLDGKRYKFYYTRVMYAAQMSSSAAEMNAVGFCWLSRCINAAQELVDQTIYKQEKIGSRPPRQILFAPGMDAEEVTGAVRMANESMDNQGLSRFAKTVVIGALNPDSRLDLIDLASLPDGFNEEVSNRLGMYIMALTGGFPPRWIWPATSVGATKADALYQHIAGTGGGASRHLNMMRNLIGGNLRGNVHGLGKVLPKSLRLVIDYQDDEQDRMQADIKRVRAEARRVDLEMGMTTVRVERERMLQNGEVTDAQFAQMELEDGRLPSGDDVLVVFADPESEYAELVDIGIPDPLLISQNDPEVVLVAIEKKRVEVLNAIAVATIKRDKERAEWALKSLDHLRSLYEAEQALMEVEEESLAGAAEEEGVTDPAGSTGNNGSSDGGSRNSRQVGFQTEPDELPEE